MAKFTIGGLTRALVCLGAMQSTCFAQSPAAAPELSTASLRPQLFGERLISTADDESHPAFTPDGKTVYFLKMIRRSITGRLLFPTNKTRRRLDKTGEPWRQNQFRGV